MLVKSLLILNSSMPCGKPFISIVMPVLNAVRHLSQSLESLAFQEWREFEVVIVDGGSQDGTIQKAHQLLSSALLSYRVDVVPGSSIYQAMNHGIEVASGEWIYVMGSDDHLLSSTVLKDIAPRLSAAQPEVLVVHGDVCIEDPGYGYGQRWDLP